MKQAKTLDERELRRVLDHVSTRTHAARNRAMIMMTFYGGFRVGEVALDPPRTRVSQSGY